MILMDKELVSILMRLVIMAVVVLVTSYVVPWIRSIMSAEDLAKIKEFTEIAVRCAEQIYTPEQWEKKKQYVFNYILDKVNALGVGLDEKDIDILIEGVVNEVKHSLRE